MALQKIKISLQSDTCLCIENLANKLNISVSELLRNLINFYLKDFINSFDDENLKNIILSKNENHKNIVNEIIMREFMVNFKERDRIINDLFMIIKTSERNSCHVHLNKYINLALKLYPNNDIMDFELKRIKTYVNNHSWKDIFLMYDRVVMENNTSNEKKQGFTLALQSTLMDFKRDKKTE